MPRKVYGNNKAIHCLSIVALLLAVFMLASCAAGGSKASRGAVSGQNGATATKTASVSPGMSRAGNSGTSGDVTQYYVRPEQEKQRSGRGLATFTTENFVGSGRCAVCHELLEDSAGNDMSIPGHWRSTMMANASKDPLWQAKVSSEVRRNPALKKVIESKCATCHMPMAWTQVYNKEEDRAVLDKGFLSPGNGLHPPAMDGVSCSLCHQIQDKNLGRKETFSGKFVIDTDGKAPERHIFGPYRDPAQDPMQQSVGFTPIYGSQINDSALCATCHTLYTPFVDAKGEVVGEFPEQTPYLEWRYSDYGVNAENRYDIGENPGQGMICQECHMPHSENGGVNIARWAPPTAEPKDHFSQHHFVGGNVFMLNVLQDNIDNLELSASTEKFEDTKERTMRQLQSKTARLSLVDIAHQVNRITAELEIDNMAGHKFPSGIPIRRAWIHLSVVDGAGQVVFESGKPLADGRIQGNDADSDTRSYEPHYDQITDPGQVQIYEGIMLNTDNEVTYTLLRAAKYAKDNRLLPKGFAKTKVPADIGVFGQALGDGNFVGGSDRVTYSIDTSNHPGPFTITARLLFTAVSQAFVIDLAADRDLPEVNRLMYLLGKNDKQFQEVAAVRTTVR